MTVGSHLLLLAPLGSAVLEPDLETERREVSGLGLVEIATQKCASDLKMSSMFLYSCLFLSYSELTYFQKILHFGIPSICYPL
jgi:hypothetical protein